MLGNSGLVPGENHYATIERTEVLADTEPNRTFHAGLPVQLCDAEKVAFIAAGQQQDAGTIAWTFDTQDPRAKWGVKFSTCDCTDAKPLDLPQAVWIVIRFMTVAEAASLYAV